MNIENKKQVATILLALGLGLVASMLMSKVVSDKVAEQTKIISNDYQKKSAALVKEIDSTKKALDNLSKNYAELSKRVEQRPVVQQARPVTERPPVQKTAFSLRTPPGKRAITMEIDTLSAVGGLVNPGDFVDIIAKLDSPDQPEPKETKPRGRGAPEENKKKIISVLFQNIQVLAVGTNYDPVGVVPPYETQKNLKTLNVTFAVSPEEAGLLAFAQANGDLQLAIRSPAETQDRVLQQVASWDALADFVLERQGTELDYGKTPAPKKDDTEGTEELKPFIQIFRGGREL